MSFIPFPEFKAQTYITVKQHTSPRDRYLQVRKKYFHLHFKRYIYDFRSYFYIRILVCVTTITEHL